MNLVNYLKDYFFAIVVYVVMIIIIGLCLIIFDVNLYLIAMILFLLIFSLLVTFINNYYKRKIFYNYLDKKLKKLDQKYLMKMAWNLRH